MKTILGQMMAHIITHTVWGVVKVMLTIILNRKKMLLRQDMSPVAGVFKVNKTNNLNRT